MSAWARAAVARVYDRGPRTVLFGPKGARALDGDSAALARAVLGRLAERASTRDELLGWLAEASGGPVEHPEVIDQLLAMLAESGAIVRATELAQPARAARPLNVVVGISGAIAASQSPSLVLSLQARGHEVRVAMTAAARRFVSAQALEAITHHPIARDAWDGRPDHPVPHLELAAWADVVVVHPASATTLSRLASGDFSELVAAVALSARCPVLVAPSMNPRMWSAPAVARNVEKISSDGLAVLHPSRGVEVADAPSARSLVLGPAPPHAVIVEAIEHLAATASPWDEIWRGRTEPIWSASQIEPELASALDALVRPGTIALDVGTGDGLVARALCDRGARVVATDVARAALDRARERASQRPIVWLIDDVRATRLASAFELITDRGCLHVLAELDGWARSMRALAAPGGKIVVMLHAPGAANPLATGRHEPEAIGRALGLDFSIESVVETRLAGHGARLLTIARGA